MPRGKRSARGLAPLPMPVVPSLPVAGEGGDTTDVRHLRCALCGLWARVDLIEEGPYPLTARMEHYGGWSVLYWDPPVPATEEDRELLLGKLREAIRDLERQELANTGGR